MSTLNVSKAISEYIENALNLPFTIYNDVIAQADGDAACLRHDPAPAAERRYIDGSRLVKWNLMFYIRNKDRTKARSYAYDITNKLDGAFIPYEGINIYTEALTLPQFLSVDDKNNTTYTAAIVCEYVVKKED